MIRIAAVGDVHAGLDSSGAIGPHYKTVAEGADVLLLAGDLTRTGRPDEARVLAEELNGVGVPTVAVLGNHDYHADGQDEIRSILEDGGITVLEGEATSVPTSEGSIGIAGLKGFCGGFQGACGTEFGEPEMKSFIRHTREAADVLHKALDSLDDDHVIALMHYAPVEQTLAGERLEIYPFLGSYLLAEAVDEAGASLVVHGHAHGGSERGVTPGGIHVRNVALPVIRRPYSIYCLDAQC